MNSRLLSIVHVMEQNDLVVYHHSGCSLLVGASEHHPTPPQKKLLNLNGKVRGNRFASELCILGQGSLPYLEEKRRKKIQNWACLPLMSKN